MHIDEDTLESLKRIFSQTSQGKWKFDEVFIRGAINTGDKHVALCNHFECAETVRCVSRAEQVANAEFICMIQNIFYDFMKGNYAISCD